MVYCYILGSIRPIEMSLLKHMSRSLMPMTEVLNLSIIADTSFTDELMQSLGFITEAGHHLWLDQPW
jgi:hypothetical protein